MHTAGLFFMGIAWGLPLLMAAFVIAVVGKAVADESKRRSTPSNAVGWMDLTIRFIKPKAEPPLLSLKDALADPAIGFAFKGPPPDWQFADPCRRAEVEAWWNGSSGEPFMKKPPLGNPPPWIHPDYHRMMELEDWCSEGCVEMGIEFEGGVYLTVHLIGGAEVELREQNSLRDAIDRAKVHIDQHRIEMSLEDPA